MFGSNQKQDNSLDLVKEILKEANVSPKKIAEIEINHLFSTRQIGIELATSALEALRGKEFNR